MGWIAKRFQQTGRAKWGKTISAEKRKAPLRKITTVLRHRDSMFDSDFVELECGHQVQAYGDLRARCVQCVKAEP